MDLTSPISSVIPSAHGVVLAILARTEKPLSGRRVAELSDGRLSPKGTHNVLKALVEAGVVLVDEQPPAKLHRLNRRHLAAESIVTLAHLRSRLLESLRGHFADWNVPAEAAWLFGSAARGDGTTGSDIDILVVRPDHVSPDDVVWAAQLDALADDVLAWTGNPCSAIEFFHAEFTALVEGGERLADELRADAVPLAGALEIRRFKTASSR